MIREVELTRSIASWDPPDWSIQGPAVQTDSHLAKGEVGEWNVTLISMDAATGTAVVEVSTPFDFSSTDAGWYDITFKSAEKYHWFFNWLYTGRTYLD